MFEEELAADKFVHLNLISTPIQQSMHQTIDVSELKKHFGNLTFSTIPQIKNLIDLAYDKEIFGTEIDPASMNLFNYQRLVAYFLIRGFIPDKSRILELGPKDSGISKRLHKKYEFWRMPDVSRLSNIFEYGEFPTIINEFQSNKQLKSSAGYFDVVFSIGDSLEPLSLTSGERELMNVNNNIDYLTKPGGVLLFCLPVYISEGNSPKYNKVLYSLFKNIHLTNFNITEYKDVNAFDHVDNLFKATVSIEDKKQSDEELSEFSYNILLSKYPNRIEENVQTRSKDFLLKRPAYFFHHLIKCGGSSLGVAMERWFEFREDLYDEGSLIPIFINNLDLFKKYKYNIETLYSDVCIRGHFQHEGIFIHQRYPEIFGREDIRIFTFIREPLNVLISLYYFGRKRQYDYMDLSLEKYLESTSNFLAKIIPCNESNFKEVIDRYFFVGIVERIQESFDKLAEKIGMRKIEVGKYNTTEKDEQVKNLKPDFIEWVKEKNSLDYKIYNYCIEKFEQF
jgi:SAM-dependent methyltransferase